MINGIEKIVDHRIIEEESPSPVLFKLLSKKEAVADGRTAIIVIWRERR